MLTFLWQQLRTQSLCTMLLGQAVCRLSSDVVPRWKICVQRGLLSVNCGSSVPTADLEHTTLASSCCALRMYSITPWSECETPLLSCVSWSVLYSAVCAYIFVFRVSLWFDAVEASCRLWFLIWRFVAPQFMASDTNATRRISLRNNFSQGLKQI